MIISALLSVIGGILNFLFNLLPDLPQLPSLIITTINNVVNLIFDNVSVIGFFIPLNVVKVLIPLVIIVVNFRYIYGIIMWIIKKIPLLNLK